MLMNALDAALAAPRLPAPYRDLVTRTLVDADDPGLRHEPTKPIGRYLPDATRRGADRARPALGGPRREGLAARGRLAGAAARSSTPPPCTALVDAGFVVVAAGGGGIPVVREDGALRGVEAVIDKDLAAALLARTVGADVLVIATDVTHAVLGFGTPEAEPLGTVDRSPRCASSPPRATSPAARWARRSRRPAGSSSTAAAAP